VRRLVQNATYRIHLRMPTRQPSASQNSSTLQYETQQNPAPSSVTPAPAVKGPALSSLAHVESGPPRQLASAALEMGSTLTPGVPLYTPSKAMSPSNKLPSLCKTAKAPPHRKNAQDGQPSVIQSGRRLSPDG